MVDWSGQMDKDHLSCLAVSLIDSVELLGPWNAISGASGVSGPCWCGRWSPWWTGRLVVVVVSVKITKSRGFWLFIIKSLASRFFPFYTNWSVFSVQTSKVITNLLGWNKIVKTLVFSFVHWLTFHFILHVLSFLKSINKISLPQHSVQTNWPYMYTLLTFHLSF